MIYKNNKTINEWYFNDAELIKVYKNGAICYYKIVGGATPSQEPCFAVVNDITQYSDTEFVDVYDKATEKWYKLNNLDQYEEYGVYGEGRNITYYEGKLTIDGDYEYEWDGSEWSNLGELSGSSVPDSYVIPFDDSTVKNICVTNWGGNVVAGEITYGEAKQVTSLGNVFKNKTTITSFNELAYFHGLTSLDNGEFIGCTNLRDIVIPSNVTTIGYDNTTRTPFSGCTNLSGLTILSGDKELTLDMFSCNGSYYMNSNNSNIPMCFPDRIMTFGTGTFGYCDYLTQAYFQNATPPVGLANSDIDNYRKLANVYCPVGSLSAYQTALAGKGKTITEYDFETDSLGLLDKEKEWIAKTQSVIVYPKYYTEKDEPENNVVFANMEEALAYECPWVGMDATIDNTPYLFGDAYEWLTKYGLFEVSGEYICDSGDKYEKMEEMVRNTDGTWSSQIPAVYEKGDLIEVGSSDCSSRLPDGYTEVEYISSENSSSSSSGGVINTGVYLYSSSSNSYQIAGRIKTFFTSGWGDNQTFINIENKTSPYNGMVWRYNNSGGYKFDTTPSGNAVLNNTVEADGTSAFTITSEATRASQQTPLGLFASWQSNMAPYRFCKMRVYSMEITLNGTLVRNFVPAVRESDSKAGLYDIVNDVFYTSSNNYNFIAGDPV